MVVIFLVICYLYLYPHSFADALLLNHQINFVDGIVDADHDDAYAASTSDDQVIPSREEKYSAESDDGLVPDVRDGLPDMGNDSPFELNAQNDPFLFHEDTAETVTFSGNDSDSSELVAYDSPFYANQEEDPEVQRIMSEDY